MADRVDWPWLTGRIFATEKNCIVEVSLGVIAELKVSADNLTLHSSSWQLSGSFKH